MHKVCCAFVLLCLATAGLAQDPVKVDPKHYSVVTENDRVRVLRIHYGPHEKSLMHEHPDAVAIFLTDGKTRFHMPDGKTEESSAKAGEVRFTPAAKHAPENTSDKAFEVVLVELKGKPAAQPPAKK
jgi:quercetin dioxygenase-like cupin family protein